MSRTLRVVFALLCALFPVQSAFCAAPEAAPASIGPMTLTTVWGGASFRHAAGVLALDVSPKLIASGGKDLCVRLWQPDGTEVRTLRGHTGWVLAVALSPDGKRVASAGWDHDVLVWSTESDAPPKRLKGHADWVQALAWSSDGTRLVSAARDSDVRVWNTATWKQVLGVQGRQFAAGAAAFAAAPEAARAAGAPGAPLASQAAGAPAHRVVLAATTVAGTRLWTDEDVAGAAKAAPVRALAMHPAGTTAIAFAGTDALVTAGGDGQLALWNLADASLIARVPAHSAGISSMAVSQNRKQLATAGGDALVRVWPLESQLARTPESTTALEKPREIQLPEGRAHVVRWADDATLLLGLESGAIVRADAASTHHERFTRGGVVALGASKSGEALAVAETSRVVTVRDTRTGKVLFELLPGELTHAVSFVAGTPERIALGGEQARVQLVGYPPRSLQTLGRHAPWVSALTVSPDGRTLVSGAGNATQILWDLDSGKELVTLKGHRAQISAIAYASATRLISASRDRRVGVWSVPDGQVVATLSGHESAVVAMAVSPDGKRAITGGENGELFVWSPPAEKPESRPRRAAGAITALAFASDGAHVVVCDASGVISWRSLPAGAVQSTASLAARGDWATSALYLPDGRLVIGTARGLLLVYR